MSVEDIPDGDTGQAIKRWALEGSDLNRPMKIDFFVKIDNESTGLDISNDPALTDFNTSIERDDETGKWPCIWSILRPTFNAARFLRDF